MISSLLVRTHQAGICPGSGVSTTRLRLCSVYARRRALTCSFRLEKIRSRACTAWSYGSIVLLCFGADPLPTLSAIDVEHIKLWPYLCSLAHTFGAFPHLQFFGDGFNFSYSPYTLIPWRMLPWPYPRPSTGILGLTLRSALRSKCTNIAVSGRWGNNWPVSLNWRGAATWSMSFRAFAALSSRHR